VNQYAITWGAKRLRDALARKYADWYGMTVNPETEITVTCGATEAMASALLAIVDPGDEVIVFEPFYENYGPDAILCGAKPVYVPLAAAQELDLDRLAAAFSTRTRAIIVCHPEQPDGPGAVAARARSDRRAVPAARRLRGDGRDLRAYPLRGGAHSHRDARRDGRAHHHDQRRVEDVQRHRLAHRHDRGPVGRDRRDPQGA